MKRLRNWLGVVNVVLAAIALPFCLLAFPAWRLRRWCRRNLLHPTR